MSDGKCGNDGLEAWIAGGSRRGLVLMGSSEAGPVLTVVVLVTSAAILIIEDA